MSLDAVILFLRDFALFVQDQFATRSGMDWMFFFMPFVVFFEFPRYYFPLVGLVVAKTTKIGKLPVKLQLGVEYSVVSQDDFGKRAVIKLNIIPVIGSLVKGPIFGGG